MNRSTTNFLHVFILVKCELNKKQNNNNNKNIKTVGVLSTYFFQITFGWRGLYMEECNSGIIICLNYQTQSYHQTYQNKYTQINQYIHQCIKKFNYK